MNRRIIISERGEKVISNEILKEAFDNYREKEDLIKDYIGKHYVKKYIEKQNEFGEYKK